MTTTAQYASVPKNGVAQVSVANPNRDGTGALVPVVLASSKVGGGARVDSLIIKAVGATTAGLLRFFLTKGRPLGDITSITFTANTATVTTLLPHGLSNGMLISVAGCLPDEFNVFDAAVSVVNATSFTYPMPVAPTTAANVIGFASSTPAVPVSRLLLEFPIPAITPSSVVASFFSPVSLGPVVLQAGWSLRVSTEKAKAFNVIPLICGDFV